jgi:hypothetical protein
MSNLTLRIDDDLLDRARRYAAEQGTTVAKIVRDHLTKLTTHDVRKEAAREALVRLCEESKSTLGGWKWNREEIYAERLSRFEHPDLRGDRSRRAGETSHRAGFAEDD